MKSNLITLIALSLLITCNLQDTKAQTSSINGNQYAFTYSGTADPPTAPTGFGLYFNQNNPAPARYEFKDNSGATVWSTEAGTGKTWSSGNILTDGDVIPAGNLRPGGSLWVGADKYAFQYYTGGSATQYGLFFSLTNTAYEFMNGTGNQMFSIGANNGDGVFTGGCQVGNSANAVAGNIRWSGSDLEVYDGSIWVSLTSGSGGGGAGDHFQIRRALATSGSPAFSTLFYIDGSGNVTGTYGNYHVASDKRLKKDITNISKSLDKVLRLRGVNFRWKDEAFDNGTLQMGFISQEVEEIVPEVVNTADDEMQTKSVEYEFLTALLAEAIKELKAEKDREVESLFHISRELKDENEALKAEIDMLKNDLWKDSDLIKANLGMDKLTSK